MCSVVCGVERLVEGVVFVLSAAVISPDDKMAVLSVWVEVEASQQLHNDGRTSVAFRFATALCQMALITGFDAEE